MVEYDPARDKLIVDGRVVSPGRARQIAGGIESALELREAYRESDLLDDCATNDRAIKLLCGPDEGNPDIPVLVEFALDDADIDAVPDDHVDSWVDRYDTHGSFIARESAVEEIFHDTAAEFSGFHVSFPDADLRAEHL